VIVFDLACSDGHRFEAWFRSGAAYDEQAEAGALVCPVCGDTRVVKAPMAPRVARAAGGEPVAKAERQPVKKGQGRGPVQEPAQILARLRGLIEANCDDVGSRFAEEARRIHFGETDARGIYGEASREEAAALREDGIDYQVLPWWQRRND
jgi:hypothetical protein